MAGSRTGDWTPEQTAAYLAENARDDAAEDLRQQAAVLRRLRSALRTCDRQRLALLEDLREAVKLIDPKKVRRCERCTGPVLGGGWCNRDGSWSCRVCK